MSATPFGSRNKTLRKNAHGDLSGNRAIRFDYAVNESLAKLLDSEATVAYKKPWHRLERGLRINRLRLFCQDMTKNRQLKQEETDALFTLLMKALDKKLLNSKTAVIYEPEQEKITEIKHLVFHENAAGNAVFSLVEKRNAVTFRKRGGALTVAPVPIPVVPSTPMAEEP
jgi:hypothetical protein